MFDDVDDFDIEDVDFPCYNNEDESKARTNNPSSVSSPERKVLKRHGTDFIHSLVEDTPPKDSPGNFKAMKRKFPGPAGLLPERLNVQSTTRSEFDTSCNHSLNNPKDKHNIEQASSQFISILETTAWKCAQHDMEHCGIQGIQSWNIAHLKRCAFSNNSKALKYPFLVVAVSHMDTGQDLFVTLNDSTGEIQGHIDSEVLEQFPIELRRGCVLVLKKVGVLKSRQARGLYLLITLNNLAVIYPSDSGISKLEMFKESCEDIDFSNLDTSINTSLDISWKETSPRQSRVTTPSANRNYQSTLNSMKQNQFVAPKTSTPKNGSAKRSNFSLVKQLPQSSNYNLPSNKNIGIVKSFAQLSSNVAFPQNQSLENNPSIVHVKKTEKDLDRSFTVLSQNGINRGEDLSSTVNSLFEGIDTDSIFEDF